MLDEETKAIMDKIIERNKSIDFERPKVKCRRCGHEFGTYCGNRARKLCSRCDWDMLAWEFRNIGRRNLMGLSQQRLSTIFIKECPSESRRFVESTITVKHRKPLKEDG